MKHKEMILIFGVGLVSAIIAFVVSGALFGSPKKNPIKVPVVVKISSEFPSPQTDDSYKIIYNDKAINPTQLIRIGGNTNPNPFQSDKAQ